MTITKKYYNQNAEHYYDSRKNLIINQQIDFFLKRINKNDLILDLGCGSGNNLFQIRKQGFNIIGADFSQNLIEILLKDRNEIVYNLDFSNPKQVNNFIVRNRIKHIFASASLLHLTKSEFNHFLQKINFEGLFFFSLKEGFGEEIDNDNRFFSYYQKSEVELLLSHRFQEIDFYYSADTLGRSNRWLNWIITKNP